MPKLTARKVETVRDPGLYGDGGGLYLRVAPTGGGLPPEKWSSLN